MAGLGGLILGLGAIAPAPALATIRQLEETPGQMVYQSRQSLVDQQGQTWQAIAFKRIRATGETGVYLRLVGFPGTAAIDRSHPLTLTSSMGQTLTASDASAAIFTDARAPEPNVGQYDLQPILPQLAPVFPWRLRLPLTHQSSVILSVPPGLVEEWQTVGHRGDQAMP